MIYFAVIIFLHQVLSQTQLLILSQDFGPTTFTTNYGWNQIGATNDIQQCSDGSNLVGVYGATYFGQDVVIYKTFEIPSHYEIEIQFQLWIIDNQQTYNLIFYVDDQVIGIITESDLIFSQNLCGDNFFDSFTTITFSTAHISSIATLLVVSTINQQIVYIILNQKIKTTWGIRDFVFRFAPCPDQCIQCQDYTSICNIWQFQQEFWTASLLTNTEGWIYNLGGYQTVQCIGQNFIKISDIGDSLTYNIVTKPNYMFRIQFQLLKAGQFVMEQIIFSINLQTQYQQTFNNEQYYTQCSGIADGDQIINFSQDFLYQQFNTNNLQLQFSSDVQSTSRFFGLRNFYLFIAPCIKNCLLCTTNNDCQQCDIDYIFDGVQCTTTLVSSPSIYNLYQSQQNIVLTTFTSSLQTQCGGLNLYGGYQQSNKIKFNVTNMPFHNQINIKINIITIDKWEIQNTLQLSLDTQLYNIINRNKYDNQNRQNLCGNNIWNDNQYEIDITLNHYSSFLLINLQFQDLSLQNSFGVLTMSIDYYYCGPKYKCSVCDASGTLCLQCSDINRLLINNCECTQSPNIQTSICPDCNQAAENQMYCPSVNLCNRSENYLPYCQSCKVGFTYDSTYNQCVQDGQTLLDQFQQFFIYSIFNDPTYQDYGDLTLYDSSGIQLSNPVGSCGSQILLGGLGFNGQIKMNFNNIPPYRRIRINYIIYLIDIDEGLKLYHQLNNYIFQFIDWNPIPKTQNLCGSEKPEFVTKIDYMIAVSGNFEYRVQLLNLINLNLMGSFGIYNINVYYQPCADQIRCKTCDDIGCLTCSVSERIQGPQCLCATYEYMNYAQCPTCPYKCQYNSCNQLGCLLCSNPQRGSPPDCLCSTYEIYGEPTCPLCQLNCLYCSQTMCLECSPGYYAYGEYCYKCPYQCQTCLQNGCLTCSSLQRGPAPFCRCSTYEIIGQSQCPQCPQNCKACNENGCLICDINRQLPLCDCLSNYYKINNECIMCENNCQTCNQYQCLTCHRPELILPYCLCPMGSVEINSQCIFDKVIIKSYGYFDNSLKQIIISFDQSFQVIGLDNYQTYSQENCVLIKVSQGICQNNNQKIIYQFDSQINYSLNDVIEINQELFYFPFKGNFEIQNILLQLDSYIDYSPVFDLTYPSKILLCRSYIIQIENVINVGYKEYIIEVINEQSINYNISNKTIKFNSKIEGILQIGIKITNFVNKYYLRVITIMVVSDDNLDFEVLPQIGQLNRYFDLIILISKINIQNCMNIVKNNTIKMIDINFSDTIILKQVTNKSKFKFRVNLGMLNIGQQYTLNITISSQQLVNTILKNYTINQIKPYFSILGGNRMVYYNNRLNVTALIVDPDNIGLMCKWQCIKLVSNQDCGFNFSSYQSQLIENYQLELYQTYQFIYDCLGYKVYANYYVTDINQDQLFMLYPAIYSNIQQNQQNPIQYLILNETNKNLLQPLLFQNMTIKIIQNQSIIQQYNQENSFGQQYLSGIEGNILIQAQLNQMVASINISLYKKVESYYISSSINKSDALTYVQFNLMSFNQSNPPYIYQYLASINNQVTYQLSDWSQYSEQQFFLPQGIQSKNYSVDIILQIMDGNGYIQNTTSSLFIKQPTQIINQIDYFLELLSNYSNFDNYKVAVGYQLLQLQEDACLKNCSNNGVCQLNKCICDKNFYLNDCSANQSQFINITSKINQLIISLIQEDYYNYIYMNLIYQLLQNDYIYQNINNEIIEQIVNQTVFQLSYYINQYSIQTSSIDVFIKKIPQIDQTLSDYENQQNLIILLKMLDISFGLVGFDSPLIIQNSTQINNQNMQLVNISKKLSLYMGLQQYIDQMPYKFDGKYINIISQRVSKNYSKKFFNNPYISKNQLNDSLYELQNESIISTVIYKTNPYYQDQNFPYKQINTQVASVQIYDFEGYQYRSSIPVFVSLISNISNQNNNPVCIAQQGNQWISNICKTIKFTNRTLCNCDTIDQQSIVNDVDNLYSSSNLYLLIQIENFMNFDYYNSYIIIILGGFTICSVLFSYAGYKKDQIDFKNYNQNKQIRFIKQQINYDSEEEDIILSQDVKRFRKRNIGQEIIVGLKKLHSFLRIYNEFSIDQPRPSRYIMFFLKQCILLSMTAIFGKGFSIIQNVILSLMSIILITPIEKVIMVGFSFNASNKLKLFIQVFIIIIYLSCWYICISASAGVGTENSNNWSFIFMLSFFINLTIVEALSIVLKILFSPFIDTFIQKGNCLARFAYFYLYDYQALAIVREINNYERPTILTTRE